MTRIAILHPANLLGEELKRELEGRSHLWQDLKLLSDDEEEVGQLTEVAGAAALIQRFDPDDLAGVDLAFFCGGIAAERPLLQRLPATTTAIVLSADAGAGDGRPVVAGVNTAAAQPGAVLVSPHAGAILVTHLLHALSPLAPERAAVTVTQPASVHGKEGLDELFEQTRAILAFATQRPEAVFGRQLAFNHYPARPQQPALAPLVAAVLGEKPPVAVQLVQGGIFHAVSASLWLRFADDPGQEGVREALAASPRFDLGAEGDDEPSPVEAANRGEILVGTIRADPGEPGAYWLWAVMDNLTVGGAVNAADLAEAVLAAGR